MGRSTWSTAVGEGSTALKADGVPAMWASRVPFAARITISKQRPGSSSSTASWFTYHDTALQRSAV
eukprot:2725704-Prymnesium_polylepis.1